MDTDFDHNPYDLLGDDHDGGHRWAFGTGFTDPLSGIDTSVPDGLDAAGLARYCLALGDDALIYSHRLQEWVTRMPELEKETALANIALDLLGQARMLLARAGGILGQTEDELAFFRDERQFRNVRLAEHADRDFAELVARWVVRLGDGTDVSLERMQRGFDAVWPLVGELFRPDADALAVIEPATVDAVLDTVLATAGLDRPEAAPLALVGGRAGRDGGHTEATGYILAELQSVARAYPDATW